MNPRLIITEEPIVTVQLLHEIGKECARCGATPEECTIAKTAKALEKCLRISSQESVLRQRAGC